MQIAKVPEMMHTERPLSRENDVKGPSLKNPSIERDVPSRALHQNRLKYIKNQNKSNVMYLFFHNIKFLVPIMKNQKKSNVLCLFFSQFKVFVPSSQTGS